MPLLSESLEFEPVPSTELRLSEASSKFPILAQSLSVEPSACGVEVNLLNPSGLII